MAALIFPKTRLNGDPLQSGDQYVGDNSVTYIYDGVKWVGHSRNLAPGTSSLVNNVQVVRLDVDGNFELPSFVLSNTTATAGQQLTWPTTGTVLTWTTDLNNQLTNGVHTVELTADGTINFPNNTIDAGTSSIAISSDVYSELAWHNNAITGDPYETLDAYVGVDSSGTYIVNESTNAGGTGSNINLWSFGTNGATTFPTLTVPINDNANPSGTGQTIKFGDSSQQAIIFGPTSTSEFPSAQRIIIQGAPGFTGTTGEGGDVYLWAGPGGSTNGDGGDIKVRAGYGPDAGQGGYLNFQAGDSGTGAGGTINIESGESGTYGSGGDITVQARSGGEIYLRTRKSNGSTNEWLFDNNGDLNIPPGGTIRNAMTGDDLLGSSVARQDTAPSAGNGTLWFNTVEGRLYIKYSDAWVDTSPLMVPAPDTDLDVESVTFADASVQTTAWTGSTSQLANGTWTFAVGSTGEVTLNGTAFVSGGGSSSDRLITGSYSMVLGADGALTFPTLTVPINDNANPSGTGQTIKFGDSSQQAIIFGPASTAGATSAERIIIQGAPGYTGTAGEGGDVYLWAGPGGSVNGNGGDIKVRAGQGNGTGTGGYLNFQAGDSATGQGGYINIESGQSGTQGLGGYIDICAQDGGDITVRTHEDGEITLRTADTVGSQHNWLFGNDGSLTFPDATVQTTAWNTSTSVYPHQMVSGSTSTIHFLSAAGTYITPPERPTYDPPTSNPNNITCVFTPTRGDNVVTTTTTIARAFTTATFHYNINLNSVGEWLSISKWAIGVSGITDDGY
jgi:hypothetical protein